MNHNDNSNYFDSKSLNILFSSLKNLEAGFSSLPAFIPKAQINDELESVINQVAKRLHNNYPYFHPLYAGQMLKPPHPVARIAYTLAMWINPNNHALDGGKESSVMEKEAVSEIAGMFGWKNYLGHLSSAGTTANLEALWIAGQMAPGKKILASDQAHYTHNRISGVLNLKFQTIESDNNARMDNVKLEDALKSNSIGTVVVTIGTTATGSIDPLEEILKLREKYGFRIHADAAYGGYFGLIDNLDSNALKTFELLSEVDSIVIDPHKQGLQPYGCGCVLFKDPTVGKYYKHDSPYTYFSSTELHLGEISLECSRAGAAAVGLWATQKLLPLIKKGDFAEYLTLNRNAAVKFYELLKTSKKFITPFKPELDIVLWAPLAEKVSISSKISKLLFDRCAESNLHLALAELPVRFFNLTGYDIEADENSITVLRSAMMKPEHYEWIEEIWEILNVAMDNLKNGKD